jgi:hypothetical protein
VRIAADTDCMISMVSTESAGWTGVATANAPEKSKTMVIRVFMPLLFWGASASKNQANKTLLHIQQAVFLLVVQNRQSMNRTNVWYFL